MAEEVVVTQILSEDMIRAGARLMEHLDKAHFPVQAALWLYRPESETWRLVIAAPRVKAEGPRKAYTRIHSILSEIPENELRVGIQNISAVDDQDPVISLLRSVIRTGQDISGIRFSKGAINGTFVEDAYIYRLL